MNALKSSLFIVLLVAQAGAGEEVRVAVASNFAATLHDLAEQFELQHQQQICISSGSTGKLYAQIRNGAPFDVLFAADIERPELLENSGLGIAGSRFTYAFGRLVLWSRDPELAASGCLAALEKPSRRRISIANPATAPYGAAARDVLKNLELWPSVVPRLVMGENINQALQFVATGNAQLGFISYAQTLDARLPETTCQWIVPRNLYAPIEQQAILLTRAGSAAENFVAFVRSAEGRKIIEQNGYLAEY